MDYEIYEGVKVGINRVTPFSVKKYQERLKQEGSKSENSIMEVVNKELPKVMKEDTITPSDIKGIIATAIQEQVISSLDIYSNREFVDEWLSIVFNITPEQKEKITDFDNKFYMDEFMRGYQDFFARLRNPSK